MGGYTLQRHVYLTKADIEERFTKEKHFAVSLFLSKEDAERAIHKMLVDNSDKIEDWLAHTGVGARLEIEGYISGKGAVVIESVNRQHKAARRIRVTIVSKELRGMAYYIHTVRLYQ
ncbi:RNase A-like domain-containing protein [Acetobacter papayae]|uniref:RNase A-like domain-containing protein n=1 Tax=Acetobacter papayae TaxID=1076592 RepID=UPI0006852609|nr:RNase A-like domain-containing protein [Acetobacter papayae]